MLMRQKKKASKPVEDDKANKLYVPLAPLQFELSNGADYQ
jgi:hypothetical protein